MAWADPLASGRYAGRYRVPGGEKRNAGTFDHEKQAYNAAVAAEMEAWKPGWRDPQSSLRPWGEWCTEWWPTRTVEPSTLKVDESRRDHRLIPKWADVALIDITRHEVRKWAGELRDDGLAPATVQRIVHLLSASLAAAMDAEILASNPASRLKLPPAVNTKEVYLSEAQRASLLEQFETGSVDEALVCLLLGTGLRWGEGVGLHLERIDLERNVVRVAEVWDNKTRCMKKYPKGKKRRDVPLPRWVCEKLEPFMSGRASGLLFEREPGIPVDYSNWRNRAWAPAIIDAGLKGVTIHDLRHTYASMLAAAGVPLEEIGRLLGHQSWLTTLRYVHLIKTAPDVVTAAVSDPFSVPVSDRDATQEVGRRRANVGQGDAPLHSNVIPFAPRGAR